MPFSRLFKNWMDLNLLQIDTLNQNFDISTNKRFSEISYYRTYDETRKPLDFI